MLYVANCYNEGKVVPKDDATAFKWFFKLESLGAKEVLASLSPEAKVEWYINTFRRCYALGTGVEKNILLAAEWYEGGGHFDDKDGLKEIADCYANGTGVEKDEEKAAEWRARSQGSIE